MLPSIWCQDSWSIKGGFIWHQSWMGSFFPSNPFFVCLKNFYFSDSKCASGVGSEAEEGWEDLNPTQHGAWCISIPRPWDQDLSCLSHPGTPETLNQLFKFVSPLSFFIIGSWLSETFFQVFLIAFYLFMYYLPLKIF